MQLFLWRHAEAEDGLIDLDRELTRRGRQQADLVGHWLRRYAPPGLRILVSPAKRTRQTADALQLPYTIVPELAPNGSADQVLAACGWPETGSDEAVLVVGHQPTMGRVAAKLLAGQEHYWSVKKGGLWWLALRQRDDDSQVVVRAVINPEFL